jgi:Etoposide-induced protein 2.4 (EI24)
MKLTVWKPRTMLTQLQGLYYFAAHRSLWRPLTSRLASTLTLSIGVTTFMFVFAYLPQAAIMAFTSGPLAAISAALLTLSESSTIINLISKTFLIQDALVDTFDGTLVSRECTDLVSDGRQVKAGRDPIARLGKLITRPLAKFTPSAIIRYVLYLPLNFIPVVGTVVFVLLQGKRNGPAAHARYFQLKEWSKSQRETFIQQNQAAYTSYVSILTW